MPRRHVTAVALLGLCTLAGCSGSSAGGSSPPTHSSAPTQSKAATTPQVNPLTGGKPSTNPVIAVKIEDTALGRPQVGTASADIVYVEQVEGGLTRLMAIFDSNLPSSVEPVRSARPSDPELAQQFGHIIFVASGGSATGIAPLDASPLVKVIGDKGGPQFHRDPNRVAPENLVVDLKKVAKDYKGPTARSIGLTWSTKVPAGATSGTSVQTQVGGTPVDFRWDPKTHRYLRIIGGAVQHTANGTVISTPNVIVQFCSITVYTKDRDVLGHPAQYTHTVGSGHAVVFRDGKRIDGTWSRTSVDSGTVLKTKDGKTIPLSPGGAWFVLAAKDAPLK